MNESREAKDREVEKVASVAMFLLRLAITFLIVSLLLHAWQRIKGNIVYGWQRITWKMDSKHPGLSKHLENQFRVVALIGLAALFLCIVYWATSPALGGSFMFWAAVTYLGVSALYLRLQFKAFIDHQAAATAAATEPPLLGSSKPMAGDQGTAIQAEQEAKSSGKPTSRLIRGARNQRS